MQEEKPDLLSMEVNVEEEYSMRRSERRGSTAQAQNVDIPVEVINANIRWRKQERARGLTPGMSIMERYLEAKASIPTLIKYSSSL